MIRHIAVACALLIGGTAQASTVILSATIRDFLESHPDMERAIDGVQTGKIARTLDADGKPVFIGEEDLEGSSFSTAENFAQWYRDVPGVNMSQPFSLALVSDGTVYSYRNTSFFPIDDQLLGNEGRSRNHHFTLELSGRLSFTEATQQFTFTGDDDLWVFVGNRLMLDIGGVHPASTKSFTGADLLAAGLGSDTKHDLKIFFAERHTVLSTFAIRTDFAVEPPSPLPMDDSLPILTTGLVENDLLDDRRRLVP